VSIELKGKLGLCAAIETVEWPDLVKLPGKDVSDMRDETRCMYDSPFLEEEDLRARNQSPRSGLLACVSVQYHNGFFNFPELIRCQNKWRANGRSRHRPDPRRA